MNKLSRRVAVVAALAALAVPLRAEIIDQVLEEGGKFTANVLFPLNHSGDREGCHQSVTWSTPSPV